MAQSAELTTFVQYYAELRDNITPGDIYQNLVSKHLLTPSEKAKIIHPARTDLEKMDELLSAVEKAIRANTEYFVKFLEALRAVPQYVELAQKMERTLEGRVSTV